MKKLIGKKGFSLVECLIAIAVFAIMSAIVMLLLTMTVNQTNSNNRVAGDLGTQVGAILLDDEEHDVNLSEANGGKSDAQKQEDILKFDIVDANGVSSTEGLKISYDYVEYWVCQLCKETVSTATLDKNGNKCTGCGEDIDRMDSTLLISGLIANGLRYGTLNANADKFALGDTIDQVRFNITSRAEGEDIYYDITGLNIHQTASAGVGEQFTIVLPDLMGTDYSYVIGNVTVDNFSPGIDVTTTKGDKSTIVIKEKGKTDGSSSDFAQLSSIKISFTLKNSETNTDFEDDYRVDGGITQAWFGTSSSQVTYDKV